MALSKLLVSPEQASYVVTDGKSVIATQLKGGAARFRADVKGATSIVRCRWQLGPQQFQYFRAFFRSTIDEGATPFLIDLKINTADIIEHTAQIVPGTMKLPDLAGETYYVSCDLEVTPEDIDSDYLDAIVMLFEEGVDLTMFAELDILVNIELATV